MGYQLVSGLPDFAAGYRAWSTACSLTAFAHLHPESLQQHRCCLPTPLSHRNTLSHNRQDHSRGWSWPSRRKPHSWDSKPRAMQVQEHQMPGPVFLSRDTQSSSKWPTEPRRLPWGFPGQIHVAKWGHFRSKKYCLFKQLTFHMYLNPAHSKETVRKR